MEPFDFPDSDPGPHTLRAGQDEDANIQRLTWALTRFTGYAGVTNLLGQRFLSDSDALAPMLTYLNRRGLYFFDNGAASQSVAPTVAGQVGMPAGAERAGARQHPDRAGDRPPAVGAGNPGARQWQRRGLGLSLSRHRRPHRRLGAGPAVAGLCSGAGFGHSLRSRNNRTALGNVALRSSCHPICPTGPASASCCSTRTARCLSASASTRPWKAGRCRRAASTRARRPQQAALRELKEEVGTDKAEIIGEMEDWVDL